MNYTRILFTREGFLAFVTATFFGIAGIAAAIPILGYAISPFVNEPHDVWRDVGSVDQFKVGSTVKVVYDNNAPLEWSGSTKLTGAWLRRNGGDSFTAYAIYCTHLGCPIKWLGDEAKIFLCPCHGSVFNADGSVAGGPAPRPLFQYPVRVRNGRVEIQTQTLPTPA